MAHKRKKRTPRKPATRRRRSRALGDTAEGHATKARNAEKAVIEYADRTERALAQNSCFSASMNVYDAIVAKGAYSAQAVEAGMNAIKHDQRVFQAWDKFRRYCGK